MSLDYNEKNITLARNLRKNATPLENHLWYDFLSKYEIRFQRQKAIDNFIADFYCHKAKLIIEIDGSQHYAEEGRQKDEFRTEILEGYDLKVIRFTNRQINTNFRGVCEYIDAAVKASLREGGGQVVKSSATLFRDKIEWREIIQTFTRTGIDEMNNSNKLIFRNE